MVSRAGVCGCFGGGGRCQVRGGRGGGGLPGARGEAETPGARSAVREMFKGWGLACWDLGCFLSLVMAARP